MELLPFGVSISVLYPPNTNTEGFAVELRDMPEQVRLISETAGLFEPNFVARRFIDDVVSGKTSTTIGLDGWMLGVLTAGAAPERSLWRAFTQVSLAGVLRAVMLVYLGHFNRIIRRCQSSKRH